MRVSRSRGRNPRQRATANPCDAAATQADINQCSAAEYREADAHLNTVYKSLVRLPQNDGDETQDYKPDDFIGMHTETTNHRIGELKHGYDIGDNKLD
jgi:Lysozyme inhibitor LprI